jgi:hypothetical protein
VCPASGTCSRRSPDRSWLDGVHRGPPPKPEHPPLRTLEVSRIREAIGSARLDGPARAAGLRRITLPSMVGGDLYKRGLHGDNPLIADKTRMACGRHDG